MEGVHSMAAQPKAPEIAQRPVLCFSLASTANEIDSKASAAESQRCLAEMLV